ncbi:MAG TPA: CHASE2 domain-containing protein, partial [bacterium]|nr:CHASE2 domain-containing protein [bacterium]
MKLEVKRHNKKLWLSMIVVVAVLVGLNVAHAPAFRSWEESGLDFLFKIRTDVPEQIPVVVVMVDEKAYEKDFGYYDPLPRRYLARLIDTLKAKGAKTIALDIAFYDKLDQLDARGDTLLRDAMHR